MKATLYKLKEGYVLCSDEKVNEENFSTHKDKFLLNPDGAIKKILTQSPDFSLLSEEDAKRIGWFDVEGLAYRHRRSYQDSFEGMNECIMNDAIHQQRGYVAGFQKHAELTADRRFTEEIEKLKRDLKHDLRESVSTINKQMFEGALWGLEKLIQSLSQPKSWEVEYKEENGVYKVTKIL
jgi:hypothetical protein